MNWIQQPVTLEGKRTRLVPLSEKYFEELIALAADKAIWTHLPADRSNRDVMLTELKSAILKRLSGEQYPFVVIDKITDKVIGSTRFMDMHPEHRKLEIGYTWYTPACWGSGYNTEAKLLMLTYCFEVLKTIRVQFVTKEQNLRSRAAIQKIGATFEGVLRNERLTESGPRNTAVYSITDTEWSQVKAMLTEKVNQLVA